MKNKMLAFRLILGLIVVSVLGVRIAKSIQFKQNCSGYLKRASDANTVESAKQELEKSIKYLEAHNLTNGYTSVFFQTPDEDIEFWYNNLKSSYKELSKVTNKTSSLEKTNMLMKLRETILDNGKEGDSLTIPDGISVYPNNLLWGILTTVSLIALIGIILSFLSYKI